MPYGETLSDFLTGQMERKRNRSNDNYSKMMGVANFAKGIWDTLNSNQEAQKARDAEAASYGEGGYRREYQKWSTDYQLAGEKSLYDYKKNNPEKPADQVWAEWLMTPDGIKYQDEAAKRKDTESEADHRRRMEEIAAGKSDAPNRTKDMTDALDTAFNKLIEQGNYTITEPDPNTGGFREVLNPEKIQSLKDTMLARIAFYKPSKEELAMVSNYIDMLFGSYNKAQSKDNESGTSDLTSILQNIKDIIAATRAASPGADLNPPTTPSANAVINPETSGSLIPGAGLGYGGGFALSQNAGIEQESQENDAAQTLEQLARQASPIEKQSIAWAAKELRKPGTTPDWPTIYAFLKSLQTKYAGINVTK